MFLGVRRHAVKNTCPKAKATTSPWNSLETTRRFYLLFYYLFIHLKLSNDEMKIYRCLSDKGKLKFQGLNSNVMIF